MGRFPDVDFVVKLKKSKLYNYFLVPRWQNISDCVRTVITLCRSVLTAIVSSTLTGHLWLLFGQAITLCRSVLISNKGLHSVTSMARTPQPQWLTTSKSGCCVTSSTFTFYIHQVLQQRKNRFLALRLQLSWRSYRAWVCIKFENDKLQMCIERI